MNSDVRLPQERMQTMIYIAMLAFLLCTVMVGAWLGCKRADRDRSKGEQSHDVILTTGGVVGVCHVALGVIFVIVGDSILEPIVPVCIIIGMLGWFSLIAGEYVRQ